MTFSPEKKIARFDLFYTLYKNSWIFLLVLAALLLLIPFSTAALFDNSIFNLEVTHLQLKFRFYTVSMVPLLLVLLPLFGLLTACVLFSFLLRKKETSIMLSAGISRARLFISRTVIAGLYLFLGIAIPMAVSYYLNLRALGGYEGLLRNAVFLTVGMFIMAMTGFFIAAVCIFAAGTIVESCLYWFGIILFPTAACSGINLLLKRLFFGNAFGVRASTGASEILPSLTEKGAFFNPLLFFRESLETNGQFIRPLETAIPDPVNGKRLLFWILICVLLALLAFFMLQIRRAESAGIFTCHPVLSECVIFISAFYAFAGVLYFLHPYNPLLGFLLGAAAFVLLHVFWRKIVFSYQSKMKKNILSFGADAAAVALICLICAPVLYAGVHHFLKTAPVQSAQITYAGAPSLLYSEASGSTSGRGYYLLSSVSFTSEEAISMVKDLQDTILETGNQPLQKADNIDQTVIPYDIIFTYEEPDGEKHTWYYDRTSFGFLENMLSLADTPEAKVETSKLFDAEQSFGTTRVLSEQAYLTSEIYLTDPSLTNTYHLTLETEKRQELLTAISADLSVLDVESIYFPQEKPAAVLMFTNNGDQDTRYFTYHLDNEYLYLNASWAHTLSWLEENGLSDLLLEQPAPETIYLQRFDPYIGINRPKPMGMYFMSYCADTPDEFLIQKDFGLKYTIDDPDEMETLVPLLQNGCYMSRGGFLACVKYSGQEKYRYCFLLETLVPEFVRG